jgi:hypothetical protein
LRAWDCKRGIRTSFFSVRLSEIVIPDLVGNPDSLWLSCILDSRSRIKYGTSFAGMTGKLWKRCFQTAPQGTVSVI